jgi:hypothetical protein
LAILALWTGSRNNIRPCRRRRIRLVASVAGLVVVGEIPRRLPDPGSVVAGRGGRQYITSHSRSLYLPSYQSTCPF